MYYAMILIILAISVACLLVRYKQEQKKVNFAVQKLKESFQYSRNCKMVGGEHSIAVVRADCTPEEFYEFMQLTKRNTLACAVYEATVKDNIVRKTRLNPTINGGEEELCYIFKGFCVVRKNQERARNHECY